MMSLQIENINKKKKILKNRISAVEKYKYRNEKFTRQDQKQI